jgi:hypothetical protein
MNGKEMTIARFEELASAYGGALHRWPASERQAAEQFLARSPEARALIEGERTFDRLLDTAPDALPSQALVERLMAARPRSVATLSQQNVRSGKFWPALVQAIWPYGSPVLPAGMLAASIMLGIGFGAAVPSAVTALGFSATTTTTTAASGTAAGEQLVSLALADNEYPEEWKR